MNKKNIILVIMLLPLLFGSPPSHSSDKETNNETYRLLNLFGDIFEHVRENYVRKTDDKELIEAAINGMLNSLDPHSSYLNPENFKNMQVHTRGKFGGLGIEVTMENGLIKVVSPIDNTPAYRAGVKSGDFITHLDDTPVLGLTLAEAIKLMRGRVGTSIKLRIRRSSSSPLEINIIRATIPIRTVRGRTDENIGIVRISSFSEPTTKGLKRAIKKINTETKGKLSGLVVDLRNNPGGLLNQAVAVSDAFLERGEIVSTRTRDKREYQRYNARKGDLIDGKPIVVLLNGGSASASEIVAGALQDHKRAIILGTRSFGKGSVQTIVPLGKNGAMRITTALYYTPSGKSIQKIGIQPDIIIQQATIETVNNINQTRESNLRGAIKNGNKSFKNNNFKMKERNKTSNKITDSDRFKADFQLQRALDILRGISILNQN